MIYDLVIQQEAIEEIKDAFNWYEKQRDGLGYELIAAIELCYEKLRQYPDHHSYYLQGRYRRIKTNRFPYLLVYEIEETTVIVISIRHTRQKPLH